MSLLRHYAYLRLTLTIRTVDSIEQQHLKFSLEMYMHVHLHTHSCIHVHACKMHTVHESERNLHVHVHVKYMPLNMLKLSCQQHYYYVFYHNNIQHGHVSRTRTCNMHVIKTPFTCKLCMYMYVNTMAILNLQR